jgi:hypothetical protein
LITGVSPTAGDHRNQFGVCAVGLRQAHHRALNPASLSRAHGGELAITCLISLEVASCGVDTAGATPGSGIHAATTAMLLLLMSVPLLLSLLLSLVCVRHGAPSLTDQAPPGQMGRVPAVKHAHAIAKPSAWSAGPTTRLMAPRYAGDDEMPDSLKHPTDCRSLLQILEPTSCSFLLRHSKSN